MKIEIKRNDKNRLVVEVDDLLEAFCSYGADEETRINLLERLICYGDFPKAFQRIMQRQSSEEWSNYSTTEGHSNAADNLRALVAENAEDAAKSVIKVLGEKVLSLAQALKDAEATKNKILEQWPETYKKYIPKDICTFSSEFIGEGEAMKMIEMAKIKFN